MATAIIISVVFALIFAALLMFVFNRRGPGPGGGLLFLFLIIFMFSWAGGVWLIPAGPIYFGTSWLGYAVIAFFIMLLLAALLPAAPRRRPDTPAGSRVTSAEAEEESKAAGVTFGLFFWILVIALAAIALFGDYESPEMADGIGPGYQSETEP